MISCRFYDNRMGKDLSKAVIEVQNVTRVMFRNCLFENRQIDMAASQFHLQDSSPVYFNDENVFNFDDLNMGQTVFKRSSQKILNSFIKGNFTILGPQGYTLTLEKHFNAQRPLFRE